MGVQLLCEVAAFLSSSCEKIDLSANQIHAAHFLSWMPSFFPLSAVPSPSGPIRSISVVSAPPRPPPSPPWPPKSPPLLPHLPPQRRSFHLRGQRTMVWNKQESRHKYWATCLSIRLFARSTHLFACSGLLASLAPSAALTSLSPRSWDSDLLDGHFVCAFFYFRP